MAPETPFTRGDSSASATDNEISPTFESENEEANTISKDNGLGTDECDEFEEVKGKINLKIIAPDGTFKKLLIKRDLVMQDVRIAIATVNKRSTLKTELRLDGSLLRECRKKIFKDRPPPFVIKWEASDRMENLLHENRLKSPISRAPGTKGLNRTVLHFAVMNGDLELVKEILNDTDLEPYMDSLMNAQDTFGETAMIVASSLGFDDIVEILLERGANPNLVSIHHRNAMMIAAEHGMSQAVRALLRANADQGPVLPGCTIPNAKYLAELNKRYGVMQVFKDHASPMTFGDADLGDTIEPAEH